MVEKLIRLPLGFAAMLPEDYSPSTKKNGNPKKSSKFLQFTHQEDLL